MTVWSRCVGGALLAAVLVSGVARADDPIRDSEAYSASQPSVGRRARDARPPDGSGPRPPSAGPIAESIDTVVEKFIRERTPCRLAGEGVPCFPTAIEREALEFSVEDSLWGQQDDGPPAPPSVPTATEINRYGANPRPVAANVGGGLDLACKAKQLLRKITGRGRTYYVYRVWDSTGERGVLREQPMDPAEYASEPRFRYELLGRFGDECEAIKAYQKVGHDARVRRGDAPPE